MRVFIIRGFGEKKDSQGNKINFDQVQADLIDPALKDCRLHGGTTGQVMDSGNIRVDMFGLILEADLVICDITIHNANVFYELGIRHALRKKHTVLIKGDPSADTTPFDLSTDKYLKYPTANPQSAVPALIAMIKASLAGHREADSPVFLLLPALREADPAEVLVVPPDFTEEVGRAEAASDQGLLRVIAQDLRGLRFETEGLRQVARAQWSLKDYSGARENWERLLTRRSNDVEACLALANLHERHYKSAKRPALLEESNQMIQRVLDNPRTTRDQKSEALALEGRNLKTLWRQEFDAETDSDRIMDLACDRRALDAYRAYRQASEMDLNAYYPGLAALQMGVILQRLAHRSKWRGLFRGNSVEAKRFKEDLDAGLLGLQHVVRAAVQRELDLQADPEKRLWPEIAAADLLFLTLSDAPSVAEIQEVVQAYETAIPGHKRFAWDAARNQLELFAKLGIKAQVAAEVFAKLGTFHTATSPQSKHVVVFAGHTVDLPGGSPRFPESKLTKARKLIREALSQLKAAVPAGGKITVMASAARGADLIAHEVCQELGLASQLCLPLPAPAVSAHAFPSADKWRSRFHALVKLHGDQALVMSERNQLPSWLANRADVDVWERGNRWVMETARASGAERLTLVAFWDQMDDGRNGGTAQLVRIAQSDGNFQLEEIDSKKLLA